MIHLHHRKSRLVVWVIVPCVLNSVANWHDETLVSLFLFQLNIHTTGHYKGFCCSNFKAQGLLRAVVVVNLGKKNLLLRIFIWVYYSLQKESKNNHKYMSKMCFSPRACTPTDWRESTLWTLAVITLKHSFAWVLSIDAKASLPACLRCPDKRLLQDERNSKQQNTCVCPFTWWYFEGFTFVYKSLFPLYILTFCQCHCLLRQCKAPHNNDLHLIFTITITTHRNKRRTDAVSYKNK
jgi:hypothetical protein